MAHDLSSLLAAYEALSDKASLYAQGLIGLISELDVELRADIRRMMGELRGVGNWSSTHFEGKLVELDRVQIKDLKHLREKLAGQLDPALRQESGSSE